MNGFVLYLLIVIPYGFPSPEVKLPIKDFLDVQDCIEASGIISDSGLVAKGESLWCEAVVFEDGYASYGGNDGQATLVR